MATREMEYAPADRLAIAEVPNGGAMAAFLAAGIGSFALGLIVLLNEMGAFTAPALYEPAGGVSGRTTLAVVVWLGAWAILHRSWKEREVAAGRVWATILALIALGLLWTFPPFWGVVS